MSKVCINCFAPWNKEDYNRMCENCLRNFEGVEVEDIKKNKRNRRTVFNVNNNGHETGIYPLFLGQSLSIHNTVNVTHPIIETLYLLQRSCGWTEDEINLEQSRQDMMEIGKGGKSRPEEVALMKLAVSYLWEADSVASRSVISLFAPFLSNSELTAMFTEQSRFEIIHAKTYSEIVRQCALDVDELIRDTVNNDALLGRMDTIIEAFDDMIYYGSMYNIYGITETITKEKYMEVILKGLMALLLLERIQFMSSFVVVFGLAENDKFKGVADLVKLVARDELIHCQMVSEVINILKEDAEWGEIFDEILPTLLTMVDEVVQNELSWNKYLFSEGRSMVGLNVNLLDEWVLFCTMDLCKLINIPYNYKQIVKNPISWSENWFEFDKVQNANQEAENIAYRLDAVQNDIDDDETFDF